MLPSILSPAPSTAPSTPPPTRDRVGRGEQTSSLVAQLAQCHDDAQRHQLTNELAAVNMPVADSVVARYRSRGIATEDLQQVAYLAQIGRASCRERGSIAVVAGGSERKKL